MTPKKHHKSANRYSSDRPISSPKEDVLQRDRFAERLAADIRAWKDHESLVIGLYGVWGCGKSSLKNLVLARLNKSRTRMPVIEFNPWQYSQSGNLTSAFFDELGLVLQSDEADHTASDSSAKLARYSKRLKFAGTVVGALGTAMSAVWGPFAPIGVAAAEALSKSANIANEGSEVAKTDAVETSQSLADMKSDLRKIFQQLKRPILVVVDDIDRLTTNEILEVFQMLKANADFPNVIFLLLFDRSIVSKALDRISDDRGNEFLEKIVQVGYHVPHPSQASIQSVLFKGLDAILQLPAIDRKWDKNRWTEIFTGGMAGYFRTLRHVNRFLGSLDFHVRQFHSEDGFEVNPVDLIGLEALRVFEPAVYERLPYSKSLLAPDSTVSMFQERKRAESEEAVRRLIDGVPQVRASFAMRILENVFPTVTPLYLNRNGLASPQLEWMRDGRVCHPDLFDTYFAYSTAEDDLSQTDVDRLVASAGDRDAFVQECESIGARGLLNIAMERLDAFKEHIPLEFMPSLIHALCDIGDILPAKLDGLWQPDPLVHAWRILFFGLLLEDDENRRFTILRDALLKSSGLILPVHVVSNEERFESREGSRFLVAESVWPDLKEIALEKLRTAANDGRLAANPHLKECLHRWSGWEKTDEVRNWCEKWCTTDQGILHLLTTFLVVVTTYGREIAKRHFIRLSTIERFIDVAKLEKRLIAIQRRKLSEKEEIAVREFQNALQRREAGLPDPD